MYVDPSTYVYKTDVTEQLQPLMKLVLIIAIHVDDLKIAGEPNHVKKLIEHIELEFGACDKTEGNFTNCGVRHRQDPNTLTITTDQIEYIKAIKRIQHPEMKGVSSDTLCSPILHQLYMSLIGAVAFTLITRLDVAVFMVHLQRVLQKPQIIHIKRLNVIVTYIQENPVEVVYARLYGPTALLMFSDSAFKKEDETGHALKGAMFLRVPISVLPLSNERGFNKLIVDMLKDIAIHILDYICRIQKHVTRSTFSSELFGVCDTQDHGFLLATLLHQLVQGACTASQAKDLREKGGWAVPMILILDAYSIFSATTAGHVKIPADSSLLAHLQYLRELLDTGILSELWWCDTRDMLSDGLTKGQVERDALQKAMRGSIVLTQTVHSWKPKQLR